MKISLKKADFQDIEFLWYLRCQPEIYKHFRSPKPVVFEDHLKWIMPVLLGLTNKELFVVEYSKKPVGQVRFDYENEEAEISISVLNSFQGKGIGTGSLKLGIENMKKKKQVKTLLAEIHKDNPSSKRLFEKMGFKLKTKEDIWLNYTLGL